MNVCHMTLTTQDGNATRDLAEVAIDPSNKLSVGSVSILTAKQKIHLQFKTMVKMGFS